MIANSDLVRWTRREWFSTALLILLVQALLVFALSDRSGIQSNAAVQKTEFNLAKNYAAPDPLLDFELQTQLFFIEPSAHGFSGPAWLHKKERNYVSITNRSAPETLRFSEAQRLASDDIYRALHAPQTRPRERLLPHTAPALLGSVSSPASRLELEGFESRAIHQAPVLKPQYHSDVLDSTIVQTGIDADGFPQVARVIQSSGSRPVDHEALGLARASRFEPQRRVDGSSENLAWGKLIFHWHTLELTNKTAAPR